MIDALRAWLDIGVIGILGIMSFVMVWCVVERYVFFRQIVLDDYDCQEQLQITLTHNLTMISTIGANAPYIGLLGTVLGILITFYDLGKSGAMIDAATVMVGLALALKATALGLVVAIPAVWFYNGLLRRVDVLIVRWRRIKGLTCR
ncbi:MAG: biopolymer transport protein ExbB [marine bacterium B5-7]|nr:MAG: biopolymer transport protein ExbB [marine bacterium B5-7]